MDRNGDQGGGINFPFLWFFQRSTVFERFPLLPEIAVLLIRENKFTD
jgi:hypothetical protein